MIPAIVLSTHTVGLGIIRSLAQHRVPICACYYLRQEMGHVSRYVKRKYRMPNPLDQEEAFIEKLLSMSKDLSGSVLFPADDASLVAASKHKDLLAKYFRTPFTDWPVTRRYIEKQYSYQVAETLGVPAPRTFMPATEADLKAGVKEIGFPCLIKPCQGHLYYDVFNRKMQQVNNEQDLLTAFREAQDSGLEVMLQEMIPGDDTSGVNYNSFYWDGIVHSDFTAEKVRLAPPKYGVPRVLISKDLPQLREPARMMLDGLGYSGFSCMEFKRDSRDGVYKFMELNGRINLSCLHSVAAGMNFIWMVYQHQTSGELPSAGKQKNGIYWIDLSKDILCTIRYQKQEKYSWGQFIKPYMQPHVFAILNWRDPLPFLKRLIGIGIMCVEAIFPAKIKKMKFFSSFFAKSQKI